MITSSTALYPSPPLPSPPLPAAPGPVNHDLVNAVILTLSTARLTWQEPETNNGPIMQYNITYCKLVTSGGMCANLLSPQTSLGPSVVLPDLLTSNEYRVTIQAVNGAGEGPVPNISSDAATFPFMSANAGQPHTQTTF